MYTFGSSQPNWHLVGKNGSALHSGADASPHIHISVTLKKKLCKVERDTENRDYMHEFCFQCRPEEPDVRNFSELLLQHKVKLSFISKRWLLALCCSLQLRCRSSLELNDCDWYGCLWNFWCESVGRFSELVEDLVYCQQLLQWHGCSVHKHQTSVQKLLHLNPKRTSRWCDFLHVIQVVHTKPNRVYTQLTQTTSTIFLHCILFLL